MKHRKQTRQHGQFRKKFEDSMKFKRKILQKIALVGPPNVGKSVIFNDLTGMYATISNYPGTTVDVMRGKTRIEEEEFEVIDTPGMYSLLPITDEERISRLLLFEDKPAVVLHIVDAKNLERMLPQTLQLLETGLNIILVLNVMDEAVNMGIKIDIKCLEKQLGIPVAVTVATKGEGIPDLKKKVENYVRANHETHRLRKDHRVRIETNRGSSKKKLYDLKART